jgi:hypothetical protein
MGSRAGDRVSSANREKSLIVRASWLAVIACIISARSYLQVRNLVNSEYSKLGNAIHHLAKRDQVVFLVKRYSDEDLVTPNLIYFSGRNIQLIVDDRQAGVFLKEHKEQQGIVFHATTARDLIGAPVVVGPAS